MTADKILVTILGIGGIVFTYWFFLMRKDQLVEASKGSIDIVVEGGYTPNTITVPVGRTTTLNFTRKDPSSCLEEVVLGDFKIKKYLPLNKKVAIPVTPQKTGTYNFECGMNMFHGKIIVEDPERSRRIT